MVVSALWTQDGLVFKDFGSDSILDRLILKRGSNSPFIGMAGNHNSVEKVIVLDGKHRESIFRENRSSMMLLLIALGVVSYCAVMITNHNDMPVLIYSLGMSLLFFSGTILIGKLLKTRKLVISDNQVKFIWRFLKRHEACVEKRMIHGVYYKTKMVGTYPQFHKNYLLYLIVKYDEGLRDLCVMVSPDVSQLNDFSESLRLKTIG